MRNDPVGCGGELVPRLSDQKRGGCMVNPTKSIDHNQPKRRCLPEMRGIEFSRYENKEVGI